VTPTSSPASAAIIAVIAVVSVAMDFAQTRCAHDAVARLREGFAPTAMARRDGAWRTCARRDLVVGDVIRLSAGDLVPADARLLETLELHVQQAALTGESLPVEKRASARAPDADAGRVFLGTSVVSGTASAEVTSVGPGTRFGEIAAGGGRRAPDTEFERGTRQYSHLIARVVLFLFLFVFLVSVAAKREPLQALLFSVALAADIILLRPGLAVLHNGILEGRRAFGNVMKYLLRGRARTSATCSAWRRRRSFSRFCRSFRPRSCSITSSTTSRR
jgi:Mg2+-importing ATPase